MKKMKSSILKSSKTSVMIQITIPIDEKEMLTTDENGERLYTGYMANSPEYGKEADLAYNIKLTSHS
jgi:hypothetical protein